LLLSIPKQPVQYFGFLVHLAWPKNRMTIPPGPANGAAHSLQRGELGRRACNRRLRMNGAWSTSKCRHRSSDDAALSADCAPLGGAALDIAAILRRACEPTSGTHKSEASRRVILPKIRDARFIAVRRGGTLQDGDHRLLGTWAADCAEHVLHLFEQARPADDRPRRAIELGRAWAGGEVSWAVARTAAGHANAAARDLRGAPRHAAYAAGQAAAVGHVAAHELGAAAYAIRAARAAAREGDGDTAARSECQWQHTQLPGAIRELVLDDQRLRNELCWFAFDC
jgi:hypothetical protein